MKKQIEEELKTKGFAIVEEDGKTNLHLTSQLNYTLRTSQSLSEAMVQTIIKEHICKIIVH